MGEFTPEHIRLVQENCPDCLCCTVGLCARGRVSVDRCHGQPIPDECRQTVYNCPCSSPATPGTAAWRHERHRVTVMATQGPLDLEVEIVLRGLADPDATHVEATWQQLATLRVHGLAAEVDDGAHVVTESGRLYLAARGQRRHFADCMVLGVDAEARTAAVSLLGYREPGVVTVQLDQLVHETGLGVAELPGARLVAEANSPVGGLEDVILTNITVPVRPFSGMYGVGE